MAENRNIEVGGRLHSIATGNVIAGANEIFDDDKNKKQSDINTETYSLVNDVNKRLSGLSPDQQSALSVAAKATNNETKLGYYVCDTEGNLAAKVISNATGYVLSPGGSMKVKMTNANTAADATLNINSTGAKALYYDGERASANNSWEAGETVEVYYDGTSYYANNVAGGSGSGDGAFDISAKTGNTYETLSAALTAANSILSAGKKKGGMSIKFIHLTPATYTVVKTEGVTEQPTGTELQEALSLESGTYTAAQMTGVTPPASGSVTYYLAVTVDETTTYTTWVITKATSDVQKYVQYRYMETATTTTAFTNVANWQGVDDEPTVGSDNLIKSGGVAKKIGIVNEADLVGNNENWKSYSDLTHVVKAGDSVQIKLTGPITFAGTADSQTFVGVYWRTRNSATTNYIIIFTGATTRTFDEYINNFTASEDCYICVEGRWHDTETLHFGIYNGLIKQVDDNKNNINSRIGYYECDTAGSTNTKTVVAPGYQLPVSGGSLKLKMIHRNTTSNNVVLNIKDGVHTTGAKPFYYNGERVSSTNSWDDNEVIEVYYDGTNYQANSVKGNFSSGVYNVSIKHPTSGPNGDGKFTIEYILDSSNVNELIPVNNRYPEMCIRFISSINNKYTQYKLRLLSFTTNDFIKVDNWHLCFDDSLHTQPITLVNGYVKPDGSIYNGGSGEWTHSDYILIDDILGDTIELSENTSGNNAGPSAIPMATYDENYNVIDHPSIIGKTVYNKSDLSPNAKYIAFTFYYKSNVIISNYAIRDQIRHIRSILNNDTVRIGDLEESVNLQKVTLIPGYIKKDGSIYNGGSAGWTHSDYIDLDTVFDNAIILNKKTSSNNSGPAAAPMAVYDSNKELIYVSQEYSGKLKYVVPFENAKYVVLTFYYKTDVFILNSSISGKVNYLNDKIDDRLNSVLLKKPLTLIRGFIVKDTGTIYTGSTDVWYRTDPLLIEDCLGDFIALTRPSDYNYQGPAVAGYATYDANLLPVTVHNGSSGFMVNKSDFGEGSVYIAFSFYGSNLPDIYILNSSVYGNLELAFTDINNLTSRVSALEQPDIVTKNIHKDAAVRATGKKALTSTDILPFSFIHVSDIHTKGDNYKCFENACEFLDHYDNIKCIIATGDLVWDTYHDPTTWYDLALAKTSKPVLNVIGNHDAGQYNATYGLASQSSDLECYNKFIAPYVNAGTLPNGVAVPGWGVVQPSNAATEGKSYYYKDFTDEKIRLIVLCEFETDYEIKPDQSGLVYSREVRAMRQAQVTWLIDTLTNTPSDYGVIVAYHQPDNLANDDNEFVSFDLVGSYRSAHGQAANIAYVYCDDKEWLPKILNAFATKSSLTLTVTQTGGVVTSSPTLVCDCDFTNVQSEFICILNGHTHRDYIGHLTNFPALKVLCVGADNLKYTSGFQPRQEGTPSEDLFNVVNIDRNRKTIKIIRIGSDASITGQVRDQMIMSYATT